MVRQATQKDIVIIESLLVEVLKIHHLGRPDIFKESGYKYDEKELSVIISDPNRPIFVYEEEGKILGHIFCVIENKQETNALKACKTLYIDDLCVEESMRGKGVGTELYEHAKSFAKSIGCHNITLHVWNENKKAIRFYESLGLKPQQTTLEELL